MRESYRMVVYRADNFQEVRSFDLSLGSIYVAVSMLSIIVAVIYFTVFAYTPLKKIIPGYGKMEVNPQFLELIQSVEDLSYQIEARETYINAMRNLVSVAEGREDNEETAVSESANNRAQPPISLDNGRRDPPKVLAASVSGSRIDPRADNEIYLTLNESNVMSPVDGVISSSFQPEIRHFGIDILAPKNSPVRSIMDGFVFHSGWDLETGYTIGIQHSGNILSFYKHNSILLKEKGTFVQAGEAVAIIGNTGTLSSGPHLHFELWHNGKPVNPKDFINFK